jgi:exodeoxyribonuclease V alpha subunit
MHGMAEALSGTIEHVVFHSADTGFAVLKVQARGRPGLVTVVGVTPKAVPGEYLEATGKWSNDRDHGRQFKAEELRCTPPHTAAGIEKFLGSGLVKGIGSHYAKKIVAAFGERTLTVIDETPSALLEIKGIGKRRVQRIRESWVEQKEVSRIMAFLQSHGVGTRRATRIYKTYGERAIDLVRENPYRLASDIWGVGFKTADELAEKLGVDRASPLRARAAVGYVMKELSDDGHVGFPEAGVVERTTALTSIDLAIIRQAVDNELQAGELVRDPTPSPLGGREPESALEPWLYLKSLHTAEVGVARLLRQLQRGRHPLPAIKIDAALGWVERAMGLELAETQRHAIRQATAEKVLVITGGPGVGKTTIVRGILEIFTAKGLRCALCAPTGRAAKRLSETTGREAKTIHRLLEFDPKGGGFSRSRGDPLDAQLIVVDETSMVDVSLMYQLLRGISPAACLVLVGDVDQLPSVGPGNVLADIIRSQAVPVVRLTEIFRQAEQSWIVRAAHRVNHGELPESAPAGQGDFYFVEAAAPATVLERIVALVRERIPARFRFDPVRDVQVLTPMNRTELGARNLNARLQEVLNPAGEGPRVERFGWTYRAGDKVLQTVNNYQRDVFNGDIGRVAQVDEADQLLVVDYDGRKVAYDFNDLDELALAYALTIHKSQGSEYPAVVIPLHTQHFVMLQRNLLYTGITRGKKLVVLVGQKKALATTVQRRDTAMRYSALARRLGEAGDF